VWRISEHASGLIPLENLFYLKMTAQKVVLISGCSSGLGFELAKVISNLPGYYVFAGMRKIEDFAKLPKVDNLAPIQLDVNSDSSVASVVAEISTRKGNVDVLVNNAGFNMFGGIESLSIDQCKQQFETNFFGCIRLMKATLPGMRSIGKGLVLNIGSIGGVWGQPLNDVYCASKFALEGLVESMAPIYDKFGIKITILEPGAFQTDIMRKQQLGTEGTTSEDLKVLYQKVTDFYQARVEDGKHGTQSAWEVAEFCTQKIIEPFFAGNNDSFPVKFQCNPHVAPIFQMKANDLDGLKTLKFSSSRMLS
jgi:short-subunit dehydrogenase